MAGNDTGSVMRAGDVGRAARRDLQFRIPRKPVVRLGLRARPEETGWIIDGARKSQVLGGAFAREHMGAVLQACDGTRTLDEIGEVTGVGPQAAFEAVSLLWTGGIVEEGDTEPAPGDPAPELARLLSRLGDSTGVNDSWQDAARRLAAARVAVVGDAELAGEMVTALEPTLPEVRLADGTPLDPDIVRNWVLEAYRLKTPDGAGTILRGTVGKWASARSTRVADVESSSRSRVLARSWAIHGQLSSGSQVHRAQFQVIARTTSGRCPTRARASATTRGSVSHGRPSSRRLRVMLLLTCSSEPSSERHISTSAAARSSGKGITGGTTTGGVSLGFAPLPLSPCLTAS